MSGKHYDVVVIGGGLAGMTAALSATESENKKNVSVFLLEKESRLGGNSSKASSGMNACGTETQKQNPEGKLDTVEAFVKDTYKSSDELGNKDLIEVLAADSAEAERFLHKFDIDLSTLLMLGGHSYPRTHKQGKPKEGERASNVGFYITSHLSSAIEKEKSSQITVATSAKVKSIEKGDNNAYVIHYDDGSDTKTITTSSVILATGGYGADVNGFLKEYKDLCTLPTTNGAFATGDGIRLATPLGASLKHMDKIQVHPTSFIDPQDPTNSTKFLAPESLRGRGGILINPINGLRFTNELNRRDYITETITKNCKGEDGIAWCWLLMNQEAVTAFGPEFGFYKFKGFFKEYPNGKEFASETGISYDNLMKTIQEYSECATDSTKADPFGKTRFPTVFNIDEPIFASKVTPAIHYTMGGIAFDTKGQVLDSEQQPIPNLFAAGEVTGGLHGQNRLGGNSLLECVVYGRRAGKNAAAAAALAEK